MTTGGVIAIAGFALSLIGSVWKLCTTITKNTEAVTSLTERFDRMDVSNEKDHTEMWDKIEEHDHSISDHEARLQVIEHDHR